METLELMIFDILLRYSNTEINTAGCSTWEVRPYSNPNSVHVCCIIFASHFSFGSGGGVPAIGCGLGLVTAFWLVVFVDKRCPDVDVADGAPKPVDVAVAETKILIKLRFSPVHQRIAHFPKAKRPPALVPHPRTVCLKYPNTSSRLESAKHRPAHFDLYHHTANNVTPSVTWTSINWPIRLDSEFEVVFAEPNDRNTVKAAAKCLKASVSGPPPATANN
uniref:Uncharacterized protein n=1 Tax=Glossina palpalis gambiensis TaxID=67801 RepID=A0A1B0BP16_9MUSC